MTKNIPQLVIRMNFIVPVSKNKKTGQLGNSPGKEFYEIKGGVISPMNVLKYHQAGLFLISKLVENPGKKQCPVFEEHYFLEGCCPSAAGYHITVQAAGE